MPSDILNFNKPCSACRRRKVRCDKSQPCKNCIRHGVSCVYEAPRESVMSQQLLHDRVERLERMMEDMAASSRSNSINGLSQRSSFSSGNSPFSSSDDFSDIPADAGTQVFFSGSSYHMGPDSWMNIEQFACEPRHLLNINIPNVPEEDPQGWPLSPSSPKPKNMSHVQLPIFKEDALWNLFFDHVEPFIRTTHQGYFWQMVAEYRQGTCGNAREAEALMFATQYITATVLPAGLIQEQLGVAKSELSAYLQKATEHALDRANFMRSRNTVLFNALLYYITCQFHVGNCEIGSTLLGLAGNIARRIGLHKDPAYYGYTPWIIEMRRRLWGHITALDSQSANMDGSESVLVSSGDVQRSHNNDDAEWTPCSLTDTDPGPYDRHGYSDASAALIRRELSRVCHTISEARRITSNCSEFVATIDETERYLSQKFIRYLDGSDPLHLVTSHWYNAMIKSLRVSLLYFHASPSKLKLQCHVFEQLQGQLYDECLACLEEFERGEKAAIPHHWQWAFRWPMPIHVVAGLLSGLARQPDHSSTDRAWEQIEVVFQRYNNEDVSMAKIPAWISIEKLCDQAMLKHPDRVHDGRSYANRLHKTESSMPFWEPQKPGGTSQIGICAVESYDQKAFQPSLSDMFSAEATNFGFTTTDIDTLFFNLNENNEFPSIDI